MIKVENLDDTPNSFNENNLEIFTMDKQNNSIIYNN